MYKSATNSEIYIQYFHKSFFFSSSLVPELLQCVMVEFRSPVLTVDLEAFESSRANSE